MKLHPCTRRIGAAFASGRPGQWIGVARLLVRTGAVVLPIVMATLPTPGVSQTIKERNVSASRSQAAARPRSESDQAVVDGWPLYRTDRGQAAFNDAMATLKVTDGAAPNARAFKGCANLDCEIALPQADADGWLPSGRIWVSPTEYTLIVHSPRLRDGQSYRRRSIMSMRYFVFHEFHNGSHNTDMHDTISSHKSSVFVPLYMSKQSTDAYGRHFVIVTQVAPYDVSSIHATNWGSAGPGIEVAKNVSDTLEPLQGLAGILVATMVKTAVPRLQVVNHRGTEGQPMLRSYERRLAGLRSLTDTQAVVLPFVPAPARHVVAATGTIDDLILRRGAQLRVHVAERASPTPPRPVAVARANVRGSTPASPATVKASLKTNPADALRPTLVEPYQPLTRQAAPEAPALIEDIRPAARPANRRGAGG